MVTAGFFNNVTRYRTAEEIVLQGYVADGFYVPSVQAVSVEGEAGVEVSSLQTVATGSNEELFPGFRGRGYAALEYDTTQRVCGAVLLLSCDSVPSPSSAGDGAVAAFFAAQRQLLPAAVPLCHAGRGQPAACCHGDAGEPGL